MTGAALHRASSAPRLLTEARVEWMVGVSSVLAMTTSVVWISDLMRLFGVTGAVVTLVIFGPVLLLGAKHWRQLLRRESASLVAVSAYAIGSAAWCTHHIDSAARSLGLLVMLAFLACFRASAVFVRTVTAASTVAAVFIPAYVLGTGGAWVDTHSGLPLLALAASLYLRRRVRWGALPLVVATVLTTIRAFIIGAVLAIFATLLRSRRGALVVLLLSVAIAGGTAVNAVDLGGERRAATIEREDIVGRFETIQEDRGSHRFDLWTALAEDAARRDPLSPEMLIGWGIGDVNYHVGRVFPLVAVSQRDHELLASAHNTIIGLLLIGGLAMVPLVLWMILDLARFASFEDQTLPILLMVLSVAVANEIFMVMDGTNALVALLFAMLRRPEQARAEQVEVRIYTGPTTFGQVPSLVEAARRLAPAPATCRPARRRKGNG